MRNIIEPKHMPNCPAYFPLLQLIKANEIGSTTTRTTMVFFQRGQTYDYKGNDYEQTFPLL